MSLVYRASETTEVFPNPVRAEGNWGKRGSRPLRHTSPKSFLPLGWVSGLHIHTNSYEHRSHSSQNSITISPPPDGDKSLNISASFQPRATRQLLPPVGTHTLHSPSVILIDVPSLTSKRESQWERQSKFSHVLPPPSSCLLPYVTQGRVVAVTGPASLGPPWDWRILAPFAYNSL